MTRAVNLFCVLGFVVVGCGAKRAPESGGAAKKDLPALTGQATEKAANRTVRMILIPLPPQRPR